MPKGIYERKAKGTYKRGQPYHRAKRNGTTGNPELPHGRKQPSAKQKAAVEAILANPEQSLGKTLTEVGYSVGPSNNNTVQVTGSKGFQDYLNERIKDEDVSDVVKQGLYANKILTNGEEYPDWGNRHKFVETVLRLKGYGQVDQPTVNVQFTNGIPRPAPIEGEVVEPDSSASPS